MGKVNDKLTIFDIIINLLKSQHSFSLLAEWWEAKYIRPGNLFDEASSIVLDSPCCFYLSGENTGSSENFDHAGIRNSELKTKFRILSSEHPEHFSLYQNYPNPFKGKTSINYQCSMLSFVSLKVYDVHWKEISTLVYEKQGPGTYQVEFDGSGLPEGVYFYRIDTESFSDTKKMFIEK